MPRQSQFKKPGHVVIGFAADDEILEVIKRHMPTYGDRSKAIRALILAGSPEDLHRKVLQLEATIEDLHYQAESSREVLAHALHIIETSTVTAEAKKPVASIDWSRFPEAIRDEVKRQYLAKHPEASL